MRRVHSINWGFVQGSAPIEPAAGLSGQQWLVTCACACGECWQCSSPSFFRTQAQHIDFC